MSGKEVAKSEYVLLQPHRFAIADLIRRKGRKYITEISNELGINRKVVSYHVRKLEKAGLVTTKLERTPRRRMKPAGEHVRRASPAPVLARYVYLTELAEKILEKHSII